MSAAVTTTRLSVKMADQQTDKVLDAQSVPVIDCKSIMETNIEKTTTNHNAAFEQSYIRIRLIAKTSK